MTTHETHRANPDAPSDRLAPQDRPAIVWHLADDGTAETGCDAGDNPLTPQLARHLVAIYTDVHDTVIDADSDNHLRHAAEATGRQYLTGTDPDTPAGEQTQPGRLIVLRWPRPSTANPQRHATRLLQACLHRLADGGSTIVVTAADNGSDDQNLQSAARAAGLQHLHDIVAIKATDNRDVFTYTTAPPKDAGAPALPRQSAATMLMVYGPPVTPRRQPRQQADRTASSGPAERCHSRHDNRTTRQHQTPGVTDDWQAR